MPIEIIQRRERIECHRYGLNFHWRTDRGAGFSFDCDEHGQIDESQLYPEAIENLRKCQDGTFDVVSEGVQKYEWSYVQPAVGRCFCGAEVDLDHFTNACECGRDFDSSGNLLAAREQWGLETGEHICDILRIP